MKTIGVVAEYNPFHNGHAYHLAESRRKAGEDAAVIAVMSGDFVQRGEASVYSKYARAEAACRCGADLVIELPLPWCAASAEGFAKAAVHILASLGTDVLSFGCETEDLDELVAVAELMGQENFIEKVLRMLKENPEQSFAAARQKAAEETLGRELTCLSRPNSILAVEYLKAIRKEGLSLKPEVILRSGPGHDEAGKGRMASAAELRNRLGAGTSIAASVPPKAEEIFRREREAGREAADRAKMDLLMLSRLRFLKREEFSDLPGAQDGLGERLYDAVRRENSYPSVLQAASTRRYPLARVRRTALYAVLGISAEAFSVLPQYARVLAFNEQGRTLLHECREKTGIPLVVKPAQVRNLSADAEAQFRLGTDAHDFYTLCYTGGETLPCGEDWRQGPAVCI